MAINEATLEARIHRLLTSVFPTFREVKVEHQQSFSIKFGHHNVLVDAKQPSSYPSRAIFDILLKIENKNIILLELKKEGLPLTNEDILQGISYARLLNQMPPIVLISNGVDNQFYNTYTSVKIERKNINFEFIQSITDSTFQLATNDYRDAVNLLLNKEPELFSKVINQISEERFQNLIGDISNFSKAICSDFSIKRNVVDEINLHFSEGEILIGLIGSAFSGKTNVLHQFFSNVKSVNNFILYIDLSDYNYSVFQQLANHFSIQTKNSITIDKIREWFINSLNNSHDSKFYLLLDNFHNQILESIKVEVIELIDLFKRTKQHILYSIDEINFSKIAFVQNRNYRSLIGEESKTIKLDELNDDEYQKTIDLLISRFQISIEQGGHYAPEYREPRIVRHLVSLANKKINPGQLMTIIAVPDYNLLSAISKNKSFTRPVRALYEKIVSCFFSEIDLRENNSDLNLIALGSGAISTESFKRRFPDEFNALIASSAIVLRELPNGMSIIYPKFHELIAIHSIEVILGLILQENKDEKPIVDICKTFINLVTPLPYSDIVGAGILMKMANAREIDLFSNIVQELIRIPPHKEKVEEGIKVMMYLEGSGYIPYTFKGDTDWGNFVTNFLPYAILSQLAGYPLALENNEEYSTYDFHLYLLYKLGSNENFLQRANARSLNNIKSYKILDLDGVGSFVSEDEGIIEPIVQSIQKCFLIIPDEIEKLYETAFEENNLILLHRIFLALRPIEFFTDLNLALKANNFIIRFDKYRNNSITE